MSLNGTSISSGRRMTAECSSLSSLSRHYCAIKLVQRMASPASQRLYPRWQSTLSSASTDTNDSTAVLEQTRQFLNQPLVSNQDWEQAEDLLQYWIRHHYHRHDPIGMHQAIAVLDKIVENERSCSVRLTNQLDELCTAWKATIVSDATHYNDDDDGSAMTSLLQPSEMIAKLDTYRSASTYFQPTIQTYNIVLEGAAAYFVDGAHDTNPAALEEGLQFCRSVLDWLVEESRMDPLLHPNSHTFQTLIKAWIRSGHPNAVDYCEGLAEQWNEVVLRLPTGGQSNAHRGLIQAWAPDDPDRAEQYLLQYADRYLQSLHAGSVHIGEEQDYPDTVTWNHVISAHAKHHDPEKAETVLHAMWKFHNALQDEVSRIQALGNSDLSQIHFDCQPNIVTYNSILSGWAKVENTDEVMSTLNLIKSFETIQPDVVTYGTAMKACVNDYEVVEMLATECLAEYQRIEEEKLARQFLGTNDSADGFQPQLQLDVRFFNNWLSACAQAGNVERMKILLQQMESTFDIIPDHASFSLLLKCVKETKDAEHAKRLLDEFKAMLSTRSVIKWISSIVRLADEVSGDSTQGDMMLEKEYLDDCFGDGHLDVPDLNEFLEIYVDAPKRVELVLNWMESRNAIDVESYRLAMRGLSLTSSEEVSPEHIEALLRQWVKQHRTVNQNSEPRVPLAELYTSAMMAWSKQGNVKETMRLFDELYEKYRVTGDPDFEPSKSTLTTVLQAYSKSYPPEPEKAEAFLKYHLETGVLQSQNELADVVMYNIILNCWAKSNHPHKSKRAEELLLSMVASADLISFNTVINCHVQSGLYHKAEDLLQELIKQAVHVKDDAVQGYSSFDDHHLRPDLATFRTVLSGWSKSKHYKAPEQAEGILYQLRDLHNTEVLPFGPDADCYRLVLISWAKAKNKNAGRRAESVLRDILSNDESNGFVDTDMFCAVLKACRQGDSNRAENVFRELYTLYTRSGSDRFKPNQQAIRAVLEAYAASSSPKAAIQAEAFLQRIAAMVQGNKLDASSGPDLICYNVLLKVISKSDARSSPATAERILRGLQESRNERMQPTTDTYRRTIDVCAAHGKIDLAESLYEEMVEKHDRDTRMDPGPSQQRSKPRVWPDIACFNAVLQACRRNKQADRAQALLFRLEERVDSGCLRISGGSNSKEMLAKCQPTLVTYNLVLACFASKGLGAQAQALLQYMIKRQGRRNGVRPDLISYNTVLNAWASNEDGAEAIVRAEYLIREELRSAGIQPDRWTYGTWLKCLAMVAKSEDAKVLSSLTPNISERAQDVLEEMKAAGLEPSERDLYHVKQCNARA